MSTRAKVGNIREMTQHGGWGTRWHYWTNDPVETVDAPDYFLGLQSHIERTHRISVISFAPDGSWSEAEFVVMASEPRLVVVQKRGEWERFAAKISRNLKAVDTGAGRFKVVDEDSGHTVAINLDQVSAFALVNAYKGDGAGEGASSEAGNERDASITTMTVPELQKAHKALTGKGFVPGTPVEEMREAHAAAVQAALEAEAA